MSAVDAGAPGVPAGRGSAADAPAERPGLASGVPGRRKLAARWPGGASGWFVAAVSLLFAASAMSSRYLFPDSYYDLYAGRYLLEHGFPDGNVFTAASPGAPWADQQWLAQVLYYAAWGLGGYRLVAALSALLVTSGFALLWLLLFRRGVPPIRVFAWTLAAVLPCLGNTGIRAQSFAYPLLALTLWLILADDQAPRVRHRTWLLIPLLIVWANTHGSVILGAALVAIYAGYRAANAVIRRERQASLPYLSLAALALASVICTPYGPGVLRYYALFAGNAELSHNVIEWAAPSPLYPVTWGFWAVLAGTLMAVTVAWHRGTRPDPVLLGLAVVLLALALTAIRNQAWFAFGGSLLGADTLARSNGGRAPVLGTVFRRVIAGALATLGAVSAGVLALTPLSQFEGQIPRHAIEVAAAMAGIHPAARILADDTSASPMLWLRPATRGRIGFDDRFEQYSPQEFTAYTDWLWVRGPRWQRVLTGYSIVVVSRRGHPSLAVALSRLPGWRVRFQDAAGVVLIRQPGT